MQQMLLLQRQKERPYGSGVRLVSSERFEKREQRTAERLAPNGNCERGSIRRYGPGKS